MPETQMLHTRWTTLWQRLCQKHELPSDLHERGFNALCRAYEGMGRYYHNLQHIEALLTLKDTYQNHLKNPEAVSLAIWYHDAVYSTLRKDSEKRSARWARRDLRKWGLPEAVVNTVSVMINTTAHHHQVPEPVDRDLLWFLDFDLNILSAHSDHYSLYVEQIRKEYRLIPEALYRQGRIKVLKTMLAADFIYHTPEFRQHKERAARENLRTEIAYWEHL